MDVLSLVRIFPAVLSAILSVVLDVSGILIAEEQHILCNFRDISSEASFTFGKFSC